MYLSSAVFLVSVVSRQAVAPLVYLPARHECRQSPRVLITPRVLMFLFVCVLHRIFILFSIPLWVKRLKSFPEEYLEVVKDTHETGGGFGSVGYGCQWKREEASKNLLRTHTTAVSSQVRRVKKTKLTRALFTCLIPTAARGSARHGGPLEKSRMSTALVTNPASKLRRK